MAEVREFPTEVLASLSGGVLLCEFSAMHEAAEYLMGHPIWTHHFASKDLWNDMRRTLLAQCPGMPTEAEGIGKENWTLWSLLHKPPEPYCPATGRREAGAP